VALSIFGHADEVVAHQDGTLRPGTDKAHIADQDVNELWELIQRGFAQKTADHQHSLVSLGGEDRPRIVFRLTDHSAEFELVKVLPPLPHRILYEEDRPGIFEPDQKGDQEPGRE